MNQPLLWIVFGAVVLVMLALDLRVFHHKPHVIKVKEALLWTLFWIAMALLFNLVVYLWLGSDPAIEFLTAYFVEKSLSVDNLFVFLVIFSYFGVPALHQHKVLFWGIFGALMMRAILIATGVTLIHQFHWVIYVFGAFLLFTGVRASLKKVGEIDPERNMALRLLRRFVPVTEGYKNGEFFVRENGRRLVTLLFIVVLVVETTDVMFALDSVPAVLAITVDPFIVYTSNVFAILGLRALYFALAGTMQRFHYLRYGVSAILIFVGMKMMFDDIYTIPAAIALGVVASILLVSVAGSTMRPAEGREQP